MNDDLYIGPTTLEPGPREPGKLAGHTARWLALSLAIILLTVFLVFYVFFSSAVVHGKSMEPTLITGDYLLITRSDGTPHRGDIVVAHIMDKGRPIELVKRVVGLPGDKIEIRGDVAFINGAPEPKLGQLIIPQSSITLPPVTVPVGDVYVMGDNRSISEDSRYIGAIPISAIRGKAVFVFAPVFRIRPI